MKSSLHRVLVCFIVCLVSGCHTSSQQASPADLTRISGKEESIILEDPRAYQYIFQKVEKALFVRQGLEAAPQK